MNKESPSMNNTFDGKTILITGGTGSFGHKFVDLTLRRFNPKKVIIYSRDEMKQSEMAKRFHGESRLRFFIGDVRDRDRLSRACRGVDVIIHAAALKIVPAAEYNPFECIKTNINGAVNVIDCALDHNVKTVVALSTDKACSPVNLYGATKLCSDKLFVAANAYVGEDLDTRFSVVRYGNVMGSRGSIIPLFSSLADSEELPITDERMTRFMISLKQGVELVWHAAMNAVGGEIFVKKIPSMLVTDIARTIAPKAKLKVIGIRPGEKLHEQMITEEDAINTLDCAGHYVVLPQIELGANRFACYKDVPRCSAGFKYSSDSNSQWMSSEDLKEWLREEYEPKASETMILTVQSEIIAPDAYEMILGTISESSSASKITQVMQAVDYIGQSQYESALLALSEVRHLRGTVPEIGLATTLAEIGTGNYRKAFMSLVPVLDSQADNQQVRKLLNSLGHVLGVNHVLDLS